MLDLPELLILDVGHGNCAILRDTVAVTIIDCGYDGKILLEMLEQLAINAVDHILISHADIDHIGGLQPLVKEIPVRNIYLNADASKRGRTWKDILTTLESAERSGTEVHIGLTSRASKKIISGEVEIEILAPSASIAASGPGGIDQDGHTLASNSMSVVIGLIHNSCRVVLLPGDMDEIGLKHLQKNHKDLEAQILIFPHHGGNPGSADGLEFAQSLCHLVQPDLVIFSLQRELYDNPKENIVRGIVATLPDTHIVCTQLSRKCSPILLASDASHLNNLPAQGLVSNTCCGGTIRIKINGDRTVYTPTPVVHQQFVKRLASPLCLQHLNRG
jgi:beta-lactamase superfamily II metal-dependent hydrolase